MYDDKRTKEKVLNQQLSNEFFDNYVAIDWSIHTIAIARMSSNSIHPKVDRDLPSSLRVIQEYLSNLRGSIILTIEESTSAQWLYVELKDYVDRILICDPCRNSLLKEGPKKDPIDAVKLCQLLRWGMLKEVFHTSNQSYYIRKLVSGYNDLVKATVRAKNQLSAIMRAECKNYKKNRDSKNSYAKLVIGEKERTIAHLESEKKSYYVEFNKLAKSNEVIRNLRKVPGLREVIPVKIYSKVIDGRRFKNKYKFWGYCGLAKHDRESGGKLYGRKNTRYSRMMKDCYKIATQGALNGKNDLRIYYDTMLKEGVSQKNARNEITRYIAKVTLAMIKNGSKYEPFKWRKKEK